MPHRVPDAAGLQRITAAYLESRSTTAAHLARLLHRRIRRCADYDPGARETYDELVRVEIARLVSLSLVDDERYAEDRVRSLRRKGTSGRKIHATLAAKGLGRETVQDALSATDGVDAELEAARTWARKHRIGPWRTGPVDPEIRRKELARMARNGFGYGVACKVVDEPAP